MEFFSAEEARAKHQSQHIDKIEEAYRDALIDIYSRINTAIQNNQFRISILALPSHLRVYLLSKGFKIEPVSDDRDLLSWKGVK